MTKKRRFSYKKLSDKKDATCYYCKDKTMYSLLDEKDGSQVWSCEICLWNVGKIKKFRKYLTPSFKLKKSSIPRVKRRENEVILEVKDQ